MDGNFSSLPCNHCAAQLDDNSLGVLQLVPGVEGRPLVQVVELHQGGGQGDALVEVPLLHVGHSGLRPPAKGQFRGILFLSLYLLEEIHRLCSKFFGGSLASKV